jgi:hypothetical protein
MTDNKVSAITPMIDRIFSEVRDIGQLYSSANVTESDRKRLRRCIEVLQSLDDDMTLDIFTELINQTSDDATSASGEDAEPSVGKDRMRTFTDMFSCVPKQYVKPSRPSGTGQDDYSFGISGQHLP